MLYDAFRKLTLDIDRFLEKMYKKYYHVGSDY